ncbi:hypothetical protein PGTUg99_035798 [Puccinia graminis f. sp. tritici]|uniref:Uncharacterized protein n=1 Tax=Puccinia graminis f. sp. tritici TaxID=56615 RepID=A0A5B0RA50_PUCGR|nr:hypothetical protein PGTUg99_035798 [Puccinia graminis f. sp. tritici]
MEKVELKDTPPSSNVPPKIDKGKSVSKKAQPNHSPVNKPKASTSARTTLGSHTPTRSNQPTPRRTPSSGQPKRVVTPKSSLPRGHPLQMTMRDMPESFAATRDALYVHIKLLWNLLEQKTIPGPPHPDTLKEFTARFSNAEEIGKTAEDVAGAALIPVKDVVTLKDLKLGRKKVGKGLVNLEEFFAAVGGAYTYMNISQKYATDLTLLIPAYNHFVHFLQTSRYNREKNQAGKFRMDEERKVISKARERFALAQNLPKRYQKVISDVNCHSDDEYCAKKGVYMVKTLRFRSENVTKFFRRLDAAILTSDELDGKHVQRRRRIVPSTPRPSIFTKPPKGQPLDFYNPTWFNDLLPQQQMDVANTREVAFLPDASQSLMGKRLPSKKLSDKKFVQQFFNQLTQPYDLTHEIEDNGDEDEETDDEEDSSFRGDEIDLANTSNEEEDEDDADEDDEDFVDDSMDTSNNGEEGNDEEEEQAREACYNAMDKM